MAIDVHLSQRDLKKLARGRKVKARDGDGDYIWIDSPRGGLRDYDG